MRKPLRPPLTEEQNQFADQNIRLVYWSVKRALLKIWSIPEEELESIAGWGLCYAIQTFTKEKKIKFSTWAKLVIDCAIKNEIKKQNRQKRKLIDVYGNKVHILSLEHEMSGRRGKYRDSIAKKIGIYNDGLSKIEGWNWIKSLPGPERRVIELRLDGYTQKEVASQMGRTRYIVQVLEKMAMARL